MGVKTACECCSDRCGDCCESEKCPSVAAVLNWIFWSMFVLSTVVFILIMYFQDIKLADPNDDDSIYYSFLNLWIFSAGLNGLYFYPWFLFHEPLLLRLERATMNWVALSVFEEVLFQFPHNLLQDVIYDLQGKNTILEYPYFTYGLSDSRWNNYNNGNGLDWYVETCNYLEGYGGIAICIVILLQKFYFTKKYNLKTAIKHNPFQCDWGCTTKRDLQNPRRTYLFILIILIRDAMLFRQTISYLSDQHVEDYPFSKVFNTNREYFKIAGIAGLYTINSIWILAPCTTFIWAYVNFRMAVNEKTLLINEDNDKSSGVIDMLEIASPEKV